MTSSVQLDRVPAPCTPLLGSAEASSGSRTHSTAQHSTQHTAHNTQHSSQSSLSRINWTPEGSRGALQSCRKGMQQRNIEQCSKHIAASKHRQWFIDGVPCVLQTVFEENSGLGVHCIALCYVACIVFNCVALCSVAELKERGVLSTSAAAVLPSWHLRLFQNELSS